MSGRPRLIDLYHDAFHALQSFHTQRSLLSETNGDSVPDETGWDQTHGIEECGNHTEDHDIEEAFQHIYYAMLFMACLWFVGKVCMRFGLPSLVGEIAVGIVLGPHALNFVPYSDALVVLGEIGLVLLVLEAGIDVSIGHLKVVGTRGLAVALFGSIVPLGIGTGLAYLYGNELQSSFAIGACLAPTSMGIALNVLRNGKVLNTPTGQLIIAAAVLDDVIALMLLSELEAISEPTVLKIVLPLIVSPLFILFFGVLAIKVTPWLIQKIMMKTAKHRHENVILLLLFVATFIMIPVCFYAGSSHLLGAFLAGLMFCTDHTIHEAWNNQIKRIMQWMLRIFFACTIGFAVPILDFWSRPVIIGGMLYFVAIIGKIATGIFAKPLTMTEFFTIAFSMSAWGEFAFILATASYSAGSMDKDSYSSVLMAVLMSVVISPLCLRATLSIAHNVKAKYLSQMRDADDNLRHPVYFCIHTKGTGKWGHQDKLLHCIFELNLEIVDFRAYNEAEYNYSHHLPIVQDVFYVLDKTLKLPPTKRLSKADERKLQDRYKTVKRSLRETMEDPHTSIDVMRWLPGVRRTDDVQSPTKTDKKRKSKTVTYCRKAAYRQARLALDNEMARSSSYAVAGISRIRPTHDAMHRNKFTYHGGIHTEQDDLLALTFIDTMTSLYNSLSPDRRGSPIGADDKEPLNAEEVFSKLNTLRTCVEKMEVFKPALSDDNGSTRSFHRLTHNNVRQHNSRHAAVGTHPLNGAAGGELSQASMHSFDQYHATHMSAIANGVNGAHAAGNLQVPFIPLSHPNLSAESASVQPYAPGLYTNGHDHASDAVDENGLHEVMLGHPLQMTSENKEEKQAPQSLLGAEHGSICGITHTRSYRDLMSTLNAANNGQHPPAASTIVTVPKPGLFSSASVPHVLHHPHPHHHLHHGLSLDTYPRDNFQLHPHHLSATHSSEHPIQLSGTESGSPTEHADEQRCDTMYGDEDEHHRPLNLYPHLDDLDEEEPDAEEKDAANKRRDSEDKGSKKQKPKNKKKRKPISPRSHNGDAAGAAGTDAEESLKRSSTWSKLFTGFRPKRLSDDESEHSTHKPLKRHSNDNVAIFDDEVQRILDPDEVPDLKKKHQLFSAFTKSKHKNGGKNHGSATTATHRKVPSQTFDSAQFNIDEIINDDEQETLPLKSADDNDDEN